MHDRDRFKLLHGPYHPPKCRVGRFLRCILRGKLRVRAMSPGPIPWPQAFIQGNRTFIVTGDLVRALRSESAQAVAHWWGVSVFTVSHWRRALGVETFNEGTRRLFRDWFPERVTDDDLARGQRRARSPEANAKRSASLTGRKLSAGHRALIAARNRTRKVSAETRRRMSEAQKRAGNRPPSGKPWTAKELALLGKVADRDLARRLGRSVQSVALRRWKLGILAARATTTDKRR